MNGAKVYVRVSADFDESGTLLPTVIFWENGEKYEIDKVIRISQGFARKGGGQGDRYEIRINGKITLLFFERNLTRSGNNIGRWFVERRNCG